MSEKNDTKSQYKRTRISNHFGGLECGDYWVKNRDWELGVGFGGEYDLARVKAPALTPNLPIIPTIYTYSQSSNHSQHSPSGH